MPKRSNTFQRVVAIIHSHMADGATVEESAMVSPIRGGEPREVDVLITSTVGGHEVRVAVEACDRSRKAYTPWVENMLGKYLDLATDKLVLYSGSGFTKPALAKANEHGIAAVSAEPLSESELERVVVNGLKSIWPKVVSLTPQRGRVWVCRPDGKTVWFKAPGDLLLFFANGDPFDFNLHESIVKKLQAQMSEVAEQIGLGEIEESMDREFKVVWQPFSVIIDGVEQRLHARFDDVQPPQLHPIESVETTGQAHIEVQRVELTHARLGDLRVAYGEVDLMGKSGVIVASDAAGEELLTLQLKGEVGSILTRHSD
jgi:hypothetical protein